MHDLLLKSLIGQPRLISKTSFKVSSLLFTLKQVLVKDLINHECFCSFGSCWFSQQSIKPLHLDEYLLILIKEFILRFQLSFDQCLATNFLKALVFFDKDLYWVFRLHSTKYDYFQTLVALLLSDVCCKVYSKVHNLAQIICYFYEQLKASMNLCFIPHPYRTIRWVICITLHVQDRIWISVKLLLL